jgi:3-oxoacid CoA-transferase subunit B
VDLVITDLGVFEVADGGLRLVDVAPEVTVEEIRSKTEAGFTVSPDLKVAA